MDKFHQISVSINGREITFQTGKIARQANGAVTVQSGETIILATACAANEASAETDFLPLRVDYQEKFSSTGKTLGGFIKREGRPSEKEILTCRLIDRPLRPMFEEGYYNEVQILSYVFSYDGIHTPDPLAICAASAALTISDIPLIKPIAAVRVGMVEDRFIVNPTFQEMGQSRLDLMLAGTEDAILMIEGYADFLTESQILEAVEEGHLAIGQICRKLQEWQATIGKPKNRSTLRLPPSNLLEEVEKIASHELKNAFRIRKKLERDEKISEISTKVCDALCNEASPIFPKTEVTHAFKNLKIKIMRKMVLEENLRMDGRQTDQIRPIYIEMPLLPRTHGSVLFTRGETQTIAVATLGGDTMAQKFEDLNGEDSKRFYLQYFFPPFSVGEVGKMGTPGRREIGHGRLAEKAIAMVIPPRDQFPYVIRLESNITESNGSSSMASVCGGCLALMDAGVPIKQPVSGIAMGLILEESGKYAILSDILGIEDALGDMDFKVAGNAHGITAFQLDIKVEGITKEIMRAALEQAKEGRIEILHKMLHACPKPKEHLSHYAPRIESLQIKPSKIGIVIGPGGKQIRAIIEESGADISIDDIGYVSITATSAESLEKAKEMILNLTSEVEIGKTYRGRIVSIVPFGIFVEIFGKEGLCHISELSHEKIQDIRAIYKEGEFIEVKVLDINDRGQIKLSHKALMPYPSKSSI
ncbi:MAG: polyribonucleotide nucleotidyltransferase [Chlamydiae bacterium]|nr:polyribonucleotide nucleotidyltransferase [Chlamydiota bacterium]